MSENRQPSIEEKDTHDEREHTDSSLRVEREKVDDVLDKDVSAVDGIADAVITRARARADEVLAKARAQTDRTATPSVPSRRVAAERARDDKVLQKERASADATLRQEREEQVALLSSERQETDSDLTNERERSDNAVATRDEFLGIVSHDLRNMLTGIVGFAALIETRASEGNQPDMLEFAQRIQRTGARMNRLIGDLVDVASIEAGMLAVTREVGDATQVVTEAMDSLQPQASAKRIALTADIMAPLPPASFDSARILQVLINILGNALKFTPAGGKVGVRVEGVDGTLRVMVRDTGQGIPRDKLLAVFERFFQVGPSDRRGVGLGLYISKCIIAAHGGRIWAESDLGLGSAFYFTLPR